MLEGYNSARCVLEELQSIFIIMFLIHTSIYRAGADWPGPLGKSQVWGEPNYDVPWDHLSTIKLSGANLFQAILWQKDSKQLGTIP